MSQTRCTSGSSLSGQNGTISATSISRACVGGTKEEKVKVRKCPAGHDTFDSSVSVWKIVCWSRSLISQLITPSWNSRILSRFPRSQCYFEIHQCPLNRNNDVEWINDFTMNSCSLTSRCLETDYLIRARNDEQRRWGTIADERSLVTRRYIVGIK